MIHARINKGKTVRDVLQIWNDQASGNRMWNDDTNTGAPFIIVSLVFTWGSISSAPTVPRHLCSPYWPALRFLTPVLRARRVTHQSYGLLLRTIEFITKKKAALACGRRALFRSKELHRRKILAAAYKKANVCRSNVRRMFILASW